MGFRATSLIGSVLSPFQVLATLLTKPQTPSQTGLSGLGGWFRAQGFWVSGLGVWELGGSQV